MLDFIFGVSHPGHWHALNMQQNPHHYSGLRHLGSSTVTMMQEKMGAGVYFNPYVEINGKVRKMKYLASFDRHLLKSLFQDYQVWRRLYRDSMQGFDRLGDALPGWSDA